MKIIAFTQMRNEVENGNLVRYLENAKQWADEIVLYDDVSTDNSVEFARKYTEHIILGKTNKGKMRELERRQELLDYVLKNITVDSNEEYWLMWMDCDEILDMNGTTGGLRKVVERVNERGGDSASFHQLNLWRGENWCRVDTRFSGTFYKRLWKVVPGIKFKIDIGPAKSLFPMTLKKTIPCDIRVIHYKFCNYRELISWRLKNDVGKQNLIDTYKDSWILNESQLRIYDVPDEIFPIENIPKHRALRPMQFEYKTIEDVDKWACNYNFPRGK